MELTPIEIVRQHLENPVGCGDAHHEATYPGACTESIAADIVRDLQRHGYLS